MKTFLFAGDWSRRGSSGGARFGLAGWCGVRSWRGSRRMVRGSSGAGSRHRGRGWCDDPDGGIGCVAAVRSWVAASKVRQEQLGSSPRSTGRTKRRLRVLGWTFEVRLDHRPRSESIGTVAPRIASSTDADEPGDNRGGWSRRSRHVVVRQWPRCRSVFHQCLRGLLSRPTAHRRQAARNGPEPPVRRRLPRPGTLHDLGEIAQLVEHTTENRGVPGSSPGLATQGSPANAGLFLWVSGGAASVRASPLGFVAFSWPKPAGFGLCRARPDPNRGQEQSERDGIARPASRRSRVASGRGLALSWSRGV